MSRPTQTRNAALRESMDQLCQNGILSVLLCMIIYGSVARVSVDSSAFNIGIIWTNGCDANFTEKVNSSVADVFVGVQKDILGNGIDLTFTPYLFCTEQNALTHIGDAFNATIPHALIGISSYSLHKSFFTFSEVYKKTYIASDFFIPTRFSSYAFSMVNDFRQTSLVMVDILDYFQWETVAIVVSEMEYWQDLATEMFIQLNINNFDAKKKFSLSSDSNMESVVDMITDSDKVVVLCLDLQDQEHFLTTAARMKRSTKHAFFTFTSSSFNIQLGSFLAYTVNEIRNASFYYEDINILENVLVVSAELPSNSSTTLKHNKTDFADPAENSFQSVTSALLLLGHMIKQYLDSKDKIYTDLFQIASRVKNVTFEANGRQVIVDQDGRTLYNYLMYDLNIDDGKFSPKLSMIATSALTWSLRYNDTLNWPGGIILPDQCFKKDISCRLQQTGPETLYVIVIFSAGLGVIILVIIIVMVFRRYWARKELTKGPHKLLLNSTDLTFLLKKDKGKGSRMMKSTMFDKPDLVKASEPNRSTVSINELSDYTETARYNGDLVHVKDLRIKGFEVKNKIMTHVRSLRDMRHENLNPCVGLLVDPVKSSLVMEYCSRGSLEDVIHNEDIKLDWDFKLSLLSDLVRGLRYIHGSPIRCHGNLKSRNCVIDSRWQLRITDYGLPGFFTALKQIRTDLEPYDLLWTCPEHLRDPILMTKGNEKADIFSLGIIMQEVALRSEPYSSTGLTPEAIIAKVKKPPPLIRPSVSPQAVPPQYIQIMKQAWSEMPEMRPTIEEVYDQFKKITGGKKANIVDTMFHMLEKYSNDLEEIVAERTTQLEEEKKKTDQLLFRMLPPTVAESLKLGRPVEAETFEETTIYFSDIVGFTTISAMSTPMQVVDLLNDLYTMFDATIDNYDVYKVETIGDAYMVSSGLPVRNGNRHAGEISTMALDLLSQCGKFTIRHMPDVPMRLRIGLHSGSCVAGVVGLTMPRYCLFGDTVNTASRMESTGSAFRIHVSQQCRDVLDILGGYLLQFRGETELKGKGKAPTYWLVGKEGFDKELPEPPEQGLESVVQKVRVVSKDQDVKAESSCNYSATADRTT
ncbi:retinal guanylyl cyclase 2-like [Haliotis rufescens]|uniref:retinal guanylyl cyclase 2-like n=1 Tax=Haliotis rufescens TaxID=6454 RepID=UPI00201F5FAE|nr:retinal guanylyl cyclase 2-like [Haliotis rufescens]